MLVLGVANHDVAAETRIVNTLIGAAVGLGFSAAFPPSAKARDAAEAVREVGAAAAAALRRIAEDLPVALTRPRVKGWLEQVHRVLPLVVEAEAALAQATERRRLNPRAMASTDRVPVLRAGLAALDRCVLAVRAMLLTLQEEAPDHADDDEHGYDADLRGAFSVVMMDIADCLEAFGTLVVAEAQNRELEVEDLLAETLEVLRETRARLTELYLVSASDETSSWLFRGSILSSIERVLSELDVEDRARQRASQQRSQPTPALTRLALQLPNYGQQRRFEVGMAGPPRAGKPPRADKPGTGRAPRPGAGPPEG